MLSLRTYRIDAAFESVLRAAKLRKPQRSSLEVVHTLVKSLDEDLPRVSGEELLFKIRELGLVSNSIFPDLIFQLATGVGKTRLMGALIAYLYRAGQSRNFLILAPRKAILEKLERECETTSLKYLLIDSALVPEPNFCFRGTLESFSNDPTRPNLFILSPQIITGADRRFAKPGDFKSSILKYLQDVDDLVVCVDESHHLGDSDDSSAWRQAVEKLEPKLHFGFTATVPDAAKDRTLYRYDLAACLRDGLYTKAVKVWIEPAPESLPEEEWDKVTLDFALQRLEAKRLSLLDFCGRHPEKPFIEPVLLVAARDTDHADQVAEWLISQRGLSRAEVHVAHSHRSPSEIELEKLIAIDRPGNSIKVVVNVFQLSEGWDVTNVYVVAPLRAMATFENAVQTMGRGLRLPYGSRVGEPEVDTLDVLCFGRETFKEIVDQATKQFGKSADGSMAVSLEMRQEDLDFPLETRPITVTLRIPVSFEIPKVRRVPPEPNLEFEITRIRELTRYVAGLDLISLDRTSTEEETLRYDLRSVVRMATLRVLSELPYLSAPVHGNDLSALIERLLEYLGAGESTEVAIDPIKLASLVTEEIDRRYKSQSAQFEVLEEATSVVPQNYEWPLRKDLDAPIDIRSIREWQ